VSAPLLRAVVHDCSQSAPDLGDAAGQQVTEAQEFTCDGCGRAWQSEMVMDRGSAPKAKWVSKTPPPEPTDQLPEDG
jgi:hypothetical protein